MEKVTVSANALYQVLNALIGESYLIRELQATRDKPPILVGNPIDTLISEFNSSVDAYNKTLAPSDKE